MGSNEINDVAPTSLAHLSKRRAHDLLRRQTHTFQSEELLCWTSSRKFGTSPWMRN
jgi:hypothetical protein